MLHLVLNIKISLMVKSFYNYEAKNELLLQNWEKFVGAGKIPKDIKSYIQQSWIRSKHYNIDSALEHSQTKMTDANEICFIKENQFLVDQSNPYLQKLLNLMDTEMLVIALSNHKSEIVSTLGKNLRTAEKINLTPGSRWSEEDRGTNGIGTTVQESKPLSIFGHEHYSSSWHEWICTSSPILDPFTNKMLGVINLSGQKDFVPLHNIALVQSIARMIENDIYEYIQSSDASNYLHHFRSKNPIVIFDEYFQIKYTNLEAVKLLHLIKGEHFPLFPKGVNLMNVQIITNQYKDFKGKTWNVTTQPFKINNRILGRIATFEKTTSITTTTNKKLAEKQITFDSIITVNKAFKQLKVLASQYATTDLNVLISGETGTGKELFAKAIHNSSDRKDEPFVVVNCGAIPKDLIASELFGYVEGAFTNALKGGKKGKFELAHNGTLFLDEVGELPLDLQPYLLRIVEEGLVYPVGATNPELIDVRIIAATNKNLKSSIEAGTFREDLFYRLNILNLNIPSLRERKGDIAALFTAFLKEQQLHFAQVDLEIFNVLQVHNWLGNVRELRNCFHKMLFNFKLQNDRNVVTVEDLPGEYVFGEKHSITVLEEELPGLNVEDALKISRGNKTNAAKILGISRMTLYRRLKQL